MITVHGQYDMSTTIEHDQTLLVKNDRSNTVKGKFTETITKDTKITIEKGDLEHKVNTGTANYYVKSDIGEKYDANQTTEVTSDQTTTVGNNIDVTAKGYIHLKAGTEIQLLVGSGKLADEKRRLDRTLWPEHRHRRQVQYPHARRGRGVQGQCQSPD